MVRWYHCAIVGFICLVGGLTLGTELRKYYTTPNTVISDVNLNNDGYPDVVSIDKKGNKLGFIGVEPGRHLRDDLFLAKQKAAEACSLETRSEEQRALIISQLEKIQ